MKHGSLFSGIGGFDLAATWMGWQNVFNCEIDPFCQRILKYHFPNTIQHADITKTDFTRYRGQIDVLTGGFPCQPFSHAGKRKGTNDNRYLWPEMLRAIREIRPTWIIGENVAGITSMVQPGSETKVENQTSLFEESDTETIHEQQYIIEAICNDFEREGYSVHPVVIPACGIGAPHKRERIWIVAHSNGRGRIQVCNDIQSSQPNGTRVNSNGCIWNVTNTNKFNGNLSGFYTGGLSQFKEAGIWTNPNPNCTRLQTQGTKQQTTGNKQYRKLHNNRSNFWEDFPTQSPVCSGNDGFSGRLDGITFSKWRAESVKGFGNAIVPQVALEIFKAIQEVEKQFG